MQALGSEYLWSCLSIKWLSTPLNFWWIFSSPLWEGIPWCHGLPTISLCASVSLAKSFYNIKYGSSIITSNVCQINLSNEIIKNKHWCFQISKITSQKVHFGILIYILSWKHLFEIYFRLLRRNNKLKTNIFWQTFDVVKWIRYWPFYR